MRLRRVCEIDCNQAGVATSTQGVLQTEGDLKTVLSEEKSSESLRMILQVGSLPIR